MNKISIGSIVIGALIILKALGYIAISWFAICSICAALVLLPIVLVFTLPFLIPILMVCGVIAAILAIPAVIIWAICHFI